MSNWEDISDVLIPGAPIKAGQVLIFDYEGSPINLKIKRKSKGKIWAERIKLYTEEDLKENLKIVDENEVRDGEDQKK